VAGSVDIESLKREAAARALDDVRDGMKLGLGTGSTARHFVDLLGAKVRAGLKIIGVPTSEATHAQASACGIPLATLDDIPHLDLTVDGADEVDPQLNLIKGGGGGLLREKIIAQASKREIIIVDETKLSPVLGTHRPVPVEVIPFGWKHQLVFLESLGAQVALRKGSDGTPYYTDQKNLILDCSFGPIPDAANLADQLSRRAGIVEHGLFINLATDLIVAGSDGIRHLQKK
jgi:ribose 5-phosphate isomerase A